MTTPQYTKKIEEVLWFWLVHDSDCDTNLTDDYSDCDCVVTHYIKNITPELLTILKETCEAVIGVDEDTSMEDDEETGAPQQDLNAIIRNNLRAEQRNRKAKLLGGDDDN